MDDTLLIVVIAVVVSGGGIAAYFLLRSAARRRQLRRWQRAWDDITAQPGNALLVFRDFVGKLRARPWRADGIKLPQAHLGATLALIRLKRYDEATGEEEQARSGELSNDDELQLCEAWLNANPRPPPPAAVEAYARYLTSPGREIALEHRADAALRTALRVPDSGNSELQQIVELARRVLVLLPLRDEAQFALGLALSRLGRWREAIGLLDAAVEAEPGNTERRLALARALAECGDEVKARVAFLDAYWADPSPTIAREAGLLCAKLTHVPFDGTQHTIAGDRSPLEM